MKDPFIVKYLSNQYIKLVDAHGKFYDKIKTIEAKQKAQEAGFDLVCFSENKDELPFCKILNYGKWKYAEEKKKKKNKVHKKVTKEIRFSPNIDDHDIEHKIGQINEFLIAGDEVLLTMRFKGIHNRHKDIGYTKMDEIVTMCLKHGEEVHRKRTAQQIAVRLKKRTEKEEKVGIQTA